jgi:hypothetical protein
MEDEQVGPGKIELLAVFWKSVCAEAGDPADPCYCVDSVLQPPLLARQAGCCGDCHSGLHG